MLITGLPIKELPNFQCQILYFCMETRFYEDSETVSFQLDGKGTSESMSLGREDGKITRSGLL